MSFWFCRFDQNTNEKYDSLSLVQLQMGIGPRAIERGLHWIFYKTEMKIWAVGCGLGWTVLKKVWADYEQLLREVFSTFCGQKIKKKNF